MEPETAAPQFRDKHRITMKAIRDRGDAVQAFADARSVVRRFPTPEHIESYISAARVLLEMGIDPTSIFGMVDLLDVLPQPIRLHWLTRMLSTDGGKNALHAAR